MNKVKNACIILSFRIIQRNSLFTAIVHTRPDHVVVVTSQEGAKLVDEIVAQAKSVLETEFTFEVHTVSDPFTSFLQGCELAQALAMSCALASSTLRGFRSNQ